jgi:hypothetical protein
VSCIIVYLLLNPFHKYWELDIIFLIAICLSAWNKSTLENGL